MSMVPLPQVVEVHADMSKWQLESQPSVPPVRPRLTQVAPPRFDPSHSSPPRIVASPQIGEQLEGEPVQLQPLSMAHDAQPSPVAVLRSSQVSPDSTTPLPQAALAQPEVS
ncbi:MAG: hypothetical protein M5U28_39400 [Sandaracinaceae bacterium]|nr:hypothetical protein [Sandaracinaceae bacterium]